MTGCAADPFAVSVIIPVHNAAPYVVAAVESALAQAETGEVMLVEDGSSDGSLDVCRGLAEKHDRVRLLRHPGGENRGASASRNLGIREARCDVLAFLDADDFYLPERFVTTREFLGADPAVDGVYEATGFHLKNEAGKAYWKRLNPKPLITMSGPVPPEELFERMTPVGNAGRFCTLGIAVRRSVFERTGLFDEHLVTHEDTAMWIKMAGVARLVHGRLDHPVAMYRWHGENHSFGLPETVKRTRLLALWVTTWRWSRRALPPARSRLLLDRLLRIAAAGGGSGIGGRVGALTRTGRLLLGYPELAMEPRFWRFFVAKVYTLVPRGGTKGPMSRLVRRSYD